MRGRQTCTSPILQSADDITGLNGLKTVLSYCIHVSIVQNPYFQFHDYIMAKHNQMNSQQALSVSKSNNIQRVKSTVNRHVDRHAILATECIIIRDSNGLVFFIWISLSTQLKEIYMRKLRASVTVLKV